MIPLISLIWPVQATSCIFALLYPYLGSIWRESVAGSVSLVEIGGSKTNGVARGSHDVTCSAGPLLQSRGPAYSVS